MAEDLVALGYPHRLCLVALQLNQDDPQAAASWLLDASAQYVLNHPEILDNDARSVSCSSSEHGVEEDEFEGDFCCRYFSARQECCSAYSHENLTDGMEIRVGNIYEYKEDLKDVSSSKSMYNSRRGRCGLVIAIHKDSQTASICFDLLGSYHSCPQISHVPVANLTSPNKLVLNTFCIAMKLQDDDLLRCLSKVKSAMYITTLRECVQNTLVMLSCSHSEVSLLEDTASQCLRIISKHAASAPCPMKRSVAPVAALQAMAQLNQKLNYSSPCCPEESETFQARSRNMIAKLVTAEIVEENKTFERYIKYEESPHPFIAVADSKPRRVCIESANCSKVCIMFDKRSHLCTRQKLLIYQDADCNDLVASISGKGYNSFAPIVIPGNCIWFKVIGKCEENAWGYKMIVTPLSLPALSLLRSTSEFFVSTYMSSRHLVDLLSELITLTSNLKSATALRVEVFRAINDILRQLSPSHMSPNTEDNLIIIITHLLDLTTEEFRYRMTNEVEAQMETSVMLRTLMETMFACLHVIPSDIPNKLLHDQLNWSMQSEHEEHKQQPDSSQVGNDSKITTKLEHHEVDELWKFCDASNVAREQVEVTSSSIFSTDVAEQVMIFCSVLRAFSDKSRSCSVSHSFLCESFINLMTPFCIKEGKQHPYPRGTCESGSVEFPGAVRLKIILDKRCATDSDDFLTFFKRYLDEEQDHRQHQLSSSFSSPPTSSSSSSSSSSCIYKLSGTKFQQACKDKAFLVMEGSKLWYNFSGKQGSNWGYRFLVYPEYSRNARLDLLHQHKKLFESLVSCVDSMEGIVDDLLCNFVNNNQEVHFLGSIASPSSLFFPAGFEMGDVLNRTNENLDEASILKNVDRVRIQHLPSLLLRFRSSMLITFNLLLADPIISLVDFSLLNQAGSLSSCIAQVKNLVLTDVKRSHVSQCLQHLTTSTQQLQVVIDRRSDMSVFQQLYNQAASLPPPLLHRPDMPYLIHFLGEGAEGYGGPYRECLSSCCSELEAGKLSLLIPCPNKQEGGTLPHQDKLIPSPSSTSPHHLCFFEFLGRMMGSAVRTGMPLDLSFPPLFWKMLVQQQTLNADLVQIDTMTGKVLMRMMREEEEENEEEERSGGLWELGDGMMEVALSDGTKVSLSMEEVTGASSVLNRPAMARAVFRLRLQENKQQVDAIRRGLLEVVHPCSLSLLDWSELESMVTGHPEVDLDLLQEHAIFRTDGDARDVVEALWRVLRNFGHKDRLRFLRFVWGRSRLPRASDFDETFKIHVLPPGDERYIAVATYLSSSPLLLSSSPKCYLLVSFLHFLASCPLFFIPSPPLLPASPQSFLLSFPTRVLI
eukprot:757948-Hanusia_phi.AAC.1